MAKRSKDLVEIRPVAVLRVAATAVEEGIALVVADPEVRAVHKLRTATRRVEAQLELLAMVTAGHPSDAHARPGKKLRKLLKDVRRTAGHVRDFDVQLEMVASVAGEGANEELTADAEKLSAWLRKKREAGAAELVAELQGHASKLGPKIEAMMTSLEPIGGEAVTRDGLLTMTQNWFEEHTRGLEEKKGEAALHDRRKAAKVARYLLETGGGRGRLRAAAGAFEAVQESGGAWHDFLALRVIAGKRLGKKAALTQLFEKQERVALEAYRGRLGEMRGAASESAPAKAGSNEAGQLQAN